MWPAQAQTVQVVVSSAQSDLQHNPTPADLMANRDIPGTNYRIVGQIQLSKINLNKSTYVSVNTKRLLLTQGSSSIAVNLAGSIGLKALSVSPIIVKFVGKNAEIDVTGDLDESTLQLTTPAGAYQGTLVITAVIL